MTNRRIAVFGGSFNPIHTGHLIMAENTLTDLALDEVLFAPAGDPPHKPAAGLAAGADRLAMISAAIADRPGFRASRIDLDGEGPSYTWRLLERVRHCHPDADIWFLLGGDSIREFPTWARPDRILELARLAVVERPGFEHAIDSSPPTPALADRADRIEAPLCDVSSTDIRQRVRDSRSIRYLVPGKVREYIDENKIYRTG